MNEKADAKDQKQKTQWKPDENLSMIIRKGDDWKPDNKLTMKFQEAKGKKEAGSKES